MKELPILFNSPMVRAILDGRKTQTRRLVKQPNRKDGAKLDLDLLRSIGVGAACPFSQAGDRLWVRETWAEDYCPSRRCRDDILYRADGEFHEQGVSDWADARWRPSIHMPRWACRITLEVTGVRVERLQEISEIDAMKEGVPCTEVGIRNPDPLHRAQFADLWEATYGPDAWDVNPWVWVVEFKKVHC